MKHEEFQPVRGAYPPLPPGVRADEGAGLGDELPGAARRRLRGNARRDFADAGLTAVLAHYPADTGPRRREVELCSTDRVVFHRTGDRARRPVPLEDVPDLVFSEAMRDVDLFVGVASIALDPTGPTAATRPRRLLARGLLRGAVRDRPYPPRRAGADRPQTQRSPGSWNFCDRFGGSMGAVNTYKIHLGSANIQIEPDDRYLCIVPAAADHPSKVMLPFEGDKVLSVILSKASCSRRITRSPMRRSSSNSAAAPEGSPSAERPPGARLQACQSCSRRARRAVRPRSWTRSRSPVASRSSSNLRIVAMTKGRRARRGRRVGAWSPERRPGRWIQVGDDPVQEPLELPPDQAGEYVGFLGGFWGFDGPASARITRDLLSWGTRPGSDRRPQGGPLLRVGSAAESRRIPNVSLNG